MKLIVGPMSELISVPEISLWDEPDISEVLAFFQGRIPEDLTKTVSANGITYATSPRCCHRFSGLSRPAPTRSSAER